MLRQIKRVLNRYLSTLFSIFVLYNLRDEEYIESFAKMSVLTSFANYIPVVAFGMNSRLVLHSNAALKSGFFSLGVLTSIVSFPFVYLLSEDWLFSFLFVLFVCALLVSRHSYSLAPDLYISRSLSLQVILYPVFALLIGKISMSVLAIIIIFLPLVSGLRLKDFFLLELKFNVDSLGRVIANEITWFVLAIVSIATMWSNQWVLMNYSMPDEVKTYDSYWKLWSLTFLAQMILLHDLPSISKEFKESSFREFSEASNIWSKLFRLLLLQMLIIVLISKFYLEFLNVDFIPLLFVLVVIQGVLFGIIIPFNFYFQVRDTRVLLRAFLMGGIIAVALKLILPISAISVSLSTVAGTIVSLYVFYKKID